MSKDEYYDVETENGIESVVRKQVKYEDSMYEVKDLKRLPCAGLSNMLELSNKLLHDIMHTQVVGKYTLAKKKMKTDIAYPYVSYLEMLVSNLNLQGKVNFLTQAQCQLLYNKSMSLTASVEVSFLDSYDMTYNQFETMRREYQEATRQLDNGNSVTTPTDHQLTSMNAQEHTAVGDAGESAESRSDAEILDQINHCIEQAQSAQTRAALRKTKDMMQKEMLVAKTFAEKAITYVEDIKLRFKESDRHTEDLAAINYDYLHALVLLAISLGHLSFPEEATATMSKCFDIIENEIRVVDESGAEITAKAFRKHAMGLKNRLGVALPANFNGAHD